MHISFGHVTFNILACSARSLSLTPSGDMYTIHDRYVNKQIHVLGLKIGAKARGAARGPGNTSMYRKPPGLHTKTFAASLNGNIYQWFNA